MKKFVVIAGLVASLTLSGCGRSTAAVTMETGTISQAKVQSSIDAILKARTKYDTTNMQLRSGADLNRGQVRTFIIYAIFDAIADDLKIKVTASELVDRKTQILNQVGGAAQLQSALVSAQMAPQDLDAYIRATVISDKLNQGLIATGLSSTDAENQVGQLIIKKAEQLKISVNPRYGAWDATAGDVVAASTALDAVTTAQR